MIATFQYVRDGELVFTGFEPTDLPAHIYADRKAARTNPDYADEVWVWFGYLNEGDPDAIGQVPPMADPVVTDDPF